MFESILVPVDGSAPSKRAVELALKVAAMTKARVRFINIVNSDALVLDTEGAPFVDPEPAIEHLTDDGKVALAAAADAASALGIGATTEQVQGEPVHRITELADEHGCDLIVMGSHGRTGLARLFLGSVADGVLRHANVPVLCIREDANASEDATAAASASGLDR